MTLSDEEAQVIGAEIWARIEPATLDQRPAMGEHLTVGDGGALDHGAATGERATMDEDLTPAGQGKVRRLPRWTRVAAAAVILFLLAGGASYLWLRNTHTPQFATITTGIGEKKIITLPDGSLLTLDAGTTIRIQNDESKDRNVEITDGQVFFDVKKEEGHPFVVHTHELTTTVLGTSFTVSAYEGMGAVNIGVVTGKVRVQGVVGASATRGTSGDSGARVLAVLEKNQELSYDKTTKAYRLIPLDESMTAWQQGRVIMNDVPFAEMAVLMQKNFGVVITTTQDAVRQTKYTTELLRSMTANEAVEVLAAIHHLKIKKQDNKIFLYK